MSTPHKIREWLQIAFTEQPERINENYFFDRTANEFYSVFITDYFLTDPNSTEDSADSPYTKDELSVLSLRIKRHENDDPSIVFIPRLTIDERKEMMQTFLDKENVYDPTIQYLVKTENGRTNLDFGNVLSGELYEKWQTFKWAFVQSKVDSFCNLQNIDLDTAGLWTDKKMTTMTLNLRDPSRQAVNPTKPWWKFW